MKLTRTQDAVFKTIYVGDWRQLLTGMFYTSLGFALLRKGDKEGSIAAHRKAVTLYPSSIANVDLGVALTENNDYQGAIQALRKAIEINPNNSTAWTNLGHALSKIKDIEGAIAAHQEAIRIDPKYVEADTNLQILFKDTEQYKRAIEFYRGQVQLNPKNSAAYTNLGFFLGKNEEQEEAIKEYREAIRLDPNNSIALSNLGNAFWNTGEKSKGLHLLWKAFELNPTNITITTDLMNTLSAMKKRQALKGLYKRIIKLKLNNSLMLNNAGVSFYKTGNIHAAKKAYREALRIDPKNKTARANLKGLGDDQAMNALGGIDLNEDLLDMRIKRDGKGFPLAVRLQDMRAFNVQGLDPIIVRILPFNPSSIR